MKRMIDSELIEGLSTDIKFDENGNVIVGKNLAVGGTTKLINGLKPIHTYTFSINNGEHQANYSLEIYIEELKEYDGSYNFIGKLYVDDITYSVQDSYMILGNYNLLSDGVITFSGVSSANSIFTYNGITFESSNIATGSKQNKLYKHVLSLSSSTHMYSGYIVYISTSNLKVASLQDLTTLLKPSKNYIYPLAGICTGLDTRDAIQFGNKTLYLKSFDKISYENNTWYFKDEYGDTEAFDSVSDTVTAL